MAGLLWTRQDQTWHMLEWSCHLGYTEHSQHNGVFVNFWQYINKTSCFSCSDFSQILWLPAECWHESPFTIHWSHEVSIFETQSLLLSVLIALCLSCPWSTKYEIHFNAWISSGLLFKGYSWLHKIYKIWVKIWGLFNDFEFSDCNNQCESSSDFSNTFR